MEVTAVSSLEQTLVVLGIGIPIAAGFAWIMGSALPKGVDKIGEYIGKGKGTRMFARENRKASKGKAPYSDGQLYFNFYS